jgi:hypothetical protein
LIPYWVLFFLTAWLAVTQLRPVQSQSARWPASWHAIFWLLVLMIGLRDEVGGDWVHYFASLEKSANIPLQELFSGSTAILQKDPAYILLNWLANQTGMGIYFIDTVCAVLFTWGLVVFCRAQPRPWLALVVAVPYLVIVVAMGYTRQGTAIGLAMIGLVALSERKMLRFVVFVVLAATFHKSAVILMPLAILAGTKNKIWTAIWVGLSSMLFYVLLLQDSADALITNYVGAEYQSQGAGIRVSMNAVPAVLFLWFRRRFVMSEADRTFWTWMSLGALGFVVALVASPSSTAVDRTALYWIPLQLFVLSRLPNAIGRPNGLNGMWVRLIVFYSAAVLFVWLFFSANSFVWLPYNNLIWS